MSLHPDPFELAQRLIEAYPADDAWERKPLATAREFLHAVDDFLAGRISEEAVLDSRFDEFKPMVHFPTGDGKSAIFSQEPVDKETLRQWRESDHCRFLEGWATEQEAHPEGSKPIHVKTALLGDAINEQYALLPAGLAQMAIAKVFSKAPMHTDGPVRIKVKQDEVNYFKNGEIPQELADFRRAASVRLEEMRRQIADDIIPQKNGFLLLHDSESIPRFARKLIHYLGDFSNLSDEAKASLVGEVVLGGNKRDVYFVDGKEISITAEDSERIANLKQAHSLLKRAQGQHDNEKAHSAQERIDGFKDDWGVVEFARIDELIKAKEEGRWVSYFAITDPAEVAWVKQSILRENRRYNTL